MKYLKTINELFDDSEMRDRNEIPFLTGNLSAKSVSKWNSVNTDYNLSDRLIFSCPFLDSLENSETGNIIEFNFDGSVEGGFYYFLIEVIHLSKEKFTLKVNAKSIVNNKVQYQKEMSRKVNSFNDLCSLINRDVLDMLITFNNFISDEFGVSNFQFDQEGISIFNPRLN
jgi:hypothetical protein